MRSSQWCWLWVLSWTSTCQVLMHEVLTCQMFTHHVFNTQCQHMKLWPISYWQVLTHCVFQHTVSTYKVMTHQYWHAKCYHTVHSVSQIQNADTSSTDTLSVKQHVVNTYSFTISSDDIILNVNTSRAWLPTKLDCFDIKFQQRSSSWNDNGMTKHNHNYINMHNSCCLRDHI